MHIIEFPLKLVTIFYKTILLLALDRFLRVLMGHQKQLCVNTNTNTDILKSFNFKNNCICVCIMFIGMEINVSMSQ